MMNLTETQRIKDAVAADPENYKSIIETTDLGVCVTNENGFYVAVNDSYSKITGYSKDELIGNNFLMVVPPDNKDELKEMHDQFIEIQIEIFSEFKIVGKDGKLIHIDVDAGFNDQIEGGRPHKFTFIQKVE
jgi:two-component system CheB/CheR fusion protein